MDDKIIMQDKKWTEYQIFCVRNEVVFDNFEQDTINLKVVAKGKYEACSIAKDYLLSRKAYLVKQVVGQGVENTTIIIDNKL